MWRWLVPCVCTIYSLNNLIGYWMHTCLQHGAKNTPCISSLCINRFCSSCQWNEIIKTATFSIKTAIYCSMLQSVSWISCLCLYVYFNTSFTTRPTWSCARIQSFQPCFRWKWLYFPLMHWCAWMGMWLLMCEFARLSIFAVECTGLAWTSLLKWTCACAFYR